jgi:hypothetical protein
LCCPTLDTLASDGSDKLHGHASESSVLQPKKAELFELNSDEEQVHDGTTVTGKVNSKSGQDTSDQ